MKKLEFWKKDEQGIEPEGEPMAEQEDDDSDLEDYLKNLQEALSAEMPDRLD